ncbi:hypothetical protein NMG60_11016414 [Bertholletia excelsa]
MAFMTCYPTQRSVSSDGKLEMTLEEIKQWLKKFDADKDGRISREELREAVRSAGGWFSGRRRKVWLRSADANGNGFVDDGEINRLLMFAQKHLGVRIVAF